MENLVSVIIPTYNRFKYLLNAINSIKSQTYKNIEIIVVNDCSTEKEYYENNIEDVKIINLTENSKKIFGYACAAYVRNQGILASNGEYIAFCDDDDIWFPDKINLQLSAMEKSGCKICSTEGLCGNGEYEENKKYIRYFADRSRKKIPQIINSDFLKIKNGLICSSVLIKREILIKINYMKNFPNCEDYDCWKRALEYTNCIYINTPLIYYDLNHGNGQNYTCDIDKNIKIPRAIPKIIHKIDIENIDDNLFEGFEVYKTIYNFESSKLVKEIMIKYLTLYKYGGFYSETNKILEDNYLIKLGYLKEPDLYINEKENIIGCSQYNITMKKILNIIENYILENGRIKKAKYFRLKASNNDNKIFGFELLQRVI